MNKITFTNDNLKLSGNFLQGNNDKEAILFIHGWNGTQQKDLTTAKLLNSHGYTCLTFELRGHGESDGDAELASRKDFLSDALAGYDFLREKVGAKTNIIVVGSSFGGYLACLLTNKRQVKSLALRVPQDYPDEKFELPKVSYHGELLSGWRQQTLNWDQTKTLESLHNFTGKVLIVESLHDEKVTKTTIQNFLNAVSEESELTHKTMDTKHSLKTIEEQDEYNSMLLNWLKDN